MILYREPSGLLPSPKRLSVTLRLNSTFKNS